MAVEPSTVVDAMLPLGQALAPFQLITADRTAFVGDDEEHVNADDAEE